MSDNRPDKVAFQLIESNNTREQDHKDNIVSDFIRKLEMLGDYLNCNFGQKKIMKFIYMGLIL